MMTFSMGKNHISQLREPGIKVAIDDFGTWYCALSLLQTLSADYLKIDRCFAEKIDSADGDTPVFDAIIALSKKLNLTMMEEGVSPQKQARFIRQPQVLLQGYFFKSRWIRPDSAHGIRTTASQTV